MPKSSSILTDAVRVEYRELQRRHARFYLSPIERWAEMNTLTLADLAALLRVNPTTLSRWKRGTSVPVSKTSWRKIDTFSAKNGLEPTIGI
jgi:hypothetical protein